MTNLLIVDDQKNIVESLRHDIAWHEIGVSHVFTACSAREARLVMRNFEVDILLTDIEMPEETGLELFRWTTVNFPDIVGIFLTSHADFAYAKNALSLGGFDYILQPARYEDIRETVQRAIDKQQRTKKLHTLEQRNRLMFDQVNHTMDMLVQNVLEKKAGDNKDLFVHLMQFFSVDYCRCVFWPLWVQIQHFVKVTTAWDEKLLKMVFANVLEEIFGKFHGKVCVGTDKNHGYFIYVITEKDELDQDGWAEGVAAFAQFINDHMDFLVTVYPEKAYVTAYYDGSIEAVMKRRLNSKNEGAVAWEEEMEDADAEHNAERIRQAVTYIRSHISQSFSRAQVAEMLHLNEEYFSRLFKKYTGSTFKDFETETRINQAKHLLKNSSFPVSVIATRAGYDNFSHFSKVFKKITGKTPQEYRKEFED